MSNDEAGPDGGPSTKYILHNSARAAHIAGEILKGISDHGSAANVGTWVSRLGAWITALVEVAIPGTLRHAVFSHFWVLVAMLATILMVISLIFSPLRSLLAPAIFIFALLIGLAVLIFVLGLLMRSWRPTTRRLGMLLTGVLILAILAIFALGLRDAYCFFTNEGQALRTQCPSAEGVP